MTPTGQQPDPVIRFANAGDEVIKLRGRIRNLQHISNINPSLVYLEINDLTLAQQELAALIHDTVKAAG